MRAPALPTLFAAVLLAGCASVPNYTTATLIDPGSVQILPSASGYATRIRTDFDKDDRDEVREGGLTASYGAMAIYGLTENQNLMLRYEHFQAADNPNGFVQGGVKFAVEPDFSFSLAYGNLFPHGLHQVNLTGYFNFPDDSPGAVFCVSPQATLYMVFGETSAAWLDVVLNGSLTYPVGERFFVTPLAGFSATALTFGALFVNFGIGAGVTF